MLKVVTDLEDTEYASWVKSVIQKALGFASLSFTAAAPDWEDIGEAHLFVAGIRPQEPERLERIEHLQQRRPDLFVVLAGSELPDVLDTWRTRFTAYLRGTRNPESLRTAALMAQKYVDEACSHKLRMSWKNVSRSIPMNQIMFIEKELRKTNVELESGEVCTSYMKMDDVLAQLDEDFVRIHFSCVVNRRFVKKVRKDSVILLDGKVLPVSRSYSRNLAPLLALQS